MRHSLRSIFLDHDIEFASMTRYKQAMLTGFLAVMCLLISTFYVVYNLLNDVDDAHSIFYVFIGSGLIAYYGNRIGHHLFAKLVVLGISTLVVFLFSAKADFRTDTHFFYILISLSGFVLFGYERIWIAILLSLTCVVLFYYSFTTGYSPLPDSDYPEAYIRSNQVINFIVAMITASVVVFFTVQLNHKTEQALSHKQAEISSQNEALTKTNSELDNFVYSTSHDLRAPLASVMGLIHIARRSNDINEMHQCLEMMSSRINRLDDFIHEIIDFSKNSRTDVQQERVQINRIVHDILDNLKHASPGAEIDFDIDIPDNLYLNTDTSRLTIILNNLIGNAIKYSDETKENSFVRIEAAKADKGLAISINDNGIGIERVHQPRIFDMFYRASERSKGSGLGLYLVKESVKKLDGSIYLRSKPGVGTTFTVMLPEN
jgi:signal transduction histidine kinase